MTTNTSSVPENQESTLIFIKYMHDIVLKISFLDTNSQNWSNGSHLKLWQVIVKIRHRCERISNILSRGWRACKNWFFMLTTFLAWGIFSIHQIKKRSKKGPSQKNFCIQKSVLSGPSAMQRNFWNIYCIFKLFCKSFKWLPLLQFWELVSKNEILRTISCIYFMKIRVDSWFSGTKLVLMHM